MSSVATLPTFSKDANQKVLLTVVSIGSALVGLGIGAASHYLYQEKKKKNSSGNSNSAVQSSGCPFMMLQGAKNPSAKDTNTQPRPTHSKPAEKLTPEQTKIIKSTAPVFKEHGVAITTLFYKNLFEANPTLQNIFNVTHQKTGQQPTALANAVWAYAENIDNLGALSGAVQLIGHKHASLNVLPEQYPVVGKFLLEAVKQHLGDAITPEILEAWRVAYNQLADIFINYEKNLMQEVGKLPHSWMGWKQFTISGKVIESNEITSFYMKPSDGSKVPVTKPGQYICVKKYCESIGFDQPRQYTISQNDGSCFRISVKRDQTQGQNAGVMSFSLHDNVRIGDKIDVSPPFGEFVLDESSDSPIVLVSAGVGLTPAIAMLAAATKPSANPRSVVYVHSARNHKSHAMKEYVAEVAKKNKNVSSSIWYTRPLPGNKEGIDYDHQGRINLLFIEDKVLLPNAEYYLCGPIDFMLNIESQLQSMGVPSSRIHSEVFGSDTR